MDEAREETHGESESGDGLTRRRLAGLAAAAAAGGLAPNWIGSERSDERAFAALPGRRKLPKPNVLFIMVDDLAWGDLSVYGHPQIRTPNIDRLATSGVRFTNGYSTSPVCSPTRFGLYTGRFPGRLPGGLKEPLNAAAEDMGIPGDHPTLASILKGRGYETAMFGKWHCGYLPWFSPTRSGWDQFMGSYGGANDHFSKIDTRGEYDLYEGERVHKDSRYYTEIIAERASRFVSRRHKRPWLLNLNFTSPHWPWEGPKDRAVSKDLTERIRNGEHPTFTLLHQDGGSLAVYKSMVESLDKAVGRIMRALKRSGAREETLVVFTSDNGGERYSYGWPFTGGKHELHEGGIRVPTIVSWPGRLRPRQVTNVPVVTHDWTPTLVELAGGKPDPEYPFDGISLVDYLFHGRRPPRRDLFWRMKDERALRRGRYKYLRTADGIDHLFDLETDKHEGADLQGKLPEKLAALRSAWEQIDSTLIPYPT